MDATRNDLGDAIVWLMRLLSEPHVTFFSGLAELILVVMCIGVMRLADRNEEPGTRYTDGLLVLLSLCVLGIGAHAVLKQ